MRKQRVNRLGPCQESISECVPEVYWLFLPPDLDNQIYALIAKVMPPLVIENGCEEYGLICPMEEVVSIALYNDISHMKIKDALPS